MQMQGQVQAPAPNIEFMAPLYLSAHLLAMLNTCQRACALSASSACGPLQSSGLGLWSDVLGVHVHPVCLLACLGDKISACKAWPAVT